MLLSNGIILGLKKICLDGFLYADFGSRCSTFPAYWTDLFEDLYPGLTSHTNKLASDFEKAQFRQDEANQLSCNFEM